MTQTQEYLLDGAKIILDLCGGTGAWSKPYADAGYDVRVITLPEHNVIDYIPPANVYGILAAPPCTMFSLARSRAKTPRDFIEGMGPVNAVIRIVFNCSPIFWALENPRGLLRQFMGQPALTFEQWEFNDKGIKPTDIWGKFNFPEKTTANRPSGLSEKFHCGRTNAKGWSKSSEKRAITPPGFAQAFFEANR